jgi:CDP-diacylglycerol--serine O-phosphatidyltransferase
MRLTKALFVLPTLFTLSSVFLGMLSIIMSMEGDFFLASLAILYAILFDMVDGRVARMTKTQSEFGMQIDSLADVCSFGMAPAVLIYCASLEDLLWFGGNASMPVAFLFLAAGAVRLARYNVMASTTTAPVKRFVGIPIPMAAGTLASLVMATELGGGAQIPPVVAAVFVVFLAFLMVSTVSYRKFFARNRVEALVLTVILVAYLGSVSLVWGPRWLVFGFMAFYITFGFGETLLLRVLARRAQATDEEALPVEDDDA